jgi:hypothetical protein
MIGLLATQCNMLGERMATGLNNPVLNNLNRPDLADGYLITSLSDKIVDSSGNQFVYFEYT